MELTDSEELLSYVGYVFYKEDIIDSHIYDVSNIYFRRAEKIKDAYLKSIVLQMICIVISEGHIFFETVSKYRKINKNNILSKGNIRQIFKLSALYIYFLSDKDLDMPKEQKDLFYESLINIFSFKKGEIKKNKYFATLYNECTINFELRYNNFMYHNIIKNNNFNPLILALTSNLLYNSYSGFLDNYHRYIKMRRPA